MINEARKWIGYLEHQSEDLLGVYTANVGKGGCTIFSHIIRKYYRWRNFSGLPWCAVFLHAIFIEALGKDNACILLGKPHPGTRVLARRMKRKKCLMKKDYHPNSGDIIFLHNGDGRISHCGIVVGTDDSKVISIEGNTIDTSGVFDKTVGGAVAVRERQLDSPAIVGYGMVLVK